MQRKIFFLIGSIVVVLLGGTFVYAQILSTVSNSIVKKIVPVQTESAYHRSTSLDRDWFDSFFGSAGAVAPITDPIISAVVPHHLAAAIPLAGFFASVQNRNPPVVVLLGPNHLQVGRDNIVTSEYEWKTPYGNIHPASAVIQKLVDQKLAVVNEPVIGGEWSVGALVPFVKRVWPKSDIVPIVLKDRASTSTLDNLAATLAKTLPPGSIVLVSVDFSHYLPYFVADFHDILAENILATGDLARLKKAEIDSVPSLYFLVKYNEAMGANAWTNVSHTNSAKLASHPEWLETTSHLIGYFTKRNSVATRTITLQFFGDIMLDRNVARAMGDRGLDYLLEKIRGQENRFFRGVDLFVANLEGAFAPKRVPTSKGIAFRFDPKWAEQLKKYNFNVFTIANNHSYDMGRKNVEFTKQTLSSAGIGYCGDQTTEGSEYNLIVGNDQNLSEPIAFICIENVTHIPDREKIATALADAIKKSRYVIVQVHGGTEYRRTSTKSQQELYRWLIDQGATAVIAHHPHVVEEIEIYQGKPIVYSLGNFIFDQYFSSDTQEGLSVGVVLAEGRVKELHLFPFLGKKSQVELMIGAKRDEFLQWMGKNSRLDGREIKDGKIIL